FQYFFFNYTANTAIYTLSLHDALPIYAKNKIGIMYSIRGDFDLAVAYLNKSIGKANEIKYVKGIMEAAYSLTRVYMQMRELKKRSEEHTSELQSRENLVCRLLLEKKKK